MSGQVVSFLVQLAVASTLLLVMATTASGLLRQSAASQRHMIWAACLLALLLAPAVASLLPGWSIRMPVLPFWSDSAAPVIESTRGATPDVSGMTEAGAAISLPGVDRPEAAGLNGPVDKPSVAWAEIVALLYLVIAGGLLLHLGYRISRVFIRLRSLSAVSDPHTTALVDHAAQGLGLRSRVDVLCDPDESTPWTWCLMRPVIVLPAEFAEWLPEERFNAVAHELAHIGRWDLAMSLLARVCAAIYWFQPLVWLAVRQMGKEAEYACDDRVLLAGASGPDYATQLLKLARSIQRAGDAAAPILAMSGPPLSARIDRILAHTMRRNHVTLTHRLTSLAAALLIATSVMSLKSEPAAAQSAAPTDVQQGAAVPDIDAIRNRGPASEAELETIVASLLERGLNAEARATIADWLLRDPFSGCELCASVLNSTDPNAVVGGQPAGLTRALVLAAVGDVEDLARTRNDPQLMMRLVQLFTHSKYEGALNLGTYYLFQARAMGELAGDDQLIALAFLVESGQYDMALELATKLDEDETSGFYHSDTTRQWLAYIGQRRMLMSRLAERFGDGVTAGREEYLPVHKEMPVYPAEAAKSGIEGYVILEYTVTAAGRVEAPRVVESSDSVFDESAIVSVDGYRYMPRTIDDQAVDVPGVRTIVRYALNR